MKNSRTVAIVVALMVAGLAACGAFYIYKGKGFSITFPKDWEQKEDFMGAALIGMSPLDGPGDTLRENVNVAVEKGLPSSINLKEYYDLSTENVQKLLTDVEVLDAGETRLDDRPAQWIKFKHRMGEIRLTAMQYYVLKGSRAYVITCTAGQDTYDAWSDKFENIVGTFRLR